MDGGQRKPGENRECEATPREATVTGIQGLRHAWGEGGVHVHVLSARERGDGGHGKPGKGMERERAPQETAAADTESQGNGLMREPVMTMTMMMKMMLLMMIMVRMVAMMSRMMMMMLPIPAFLNDATCEKKTLCWFRGILYPPII